ncbi:hypothetical protein KR018_008049 [Drosophila ironensis]|nr:hypothetical protein KR018_008049 [Drosophila ironensis]
MDRWQDRVAVVTGASSGIGAAVARQLVQHGMVVVGLARRVERMEQMRDQMPAEQQDRFHAIHCDVGDLGSVTAAFDWLEERLGGCDVLVNNAGCLFPGQLLTLDPDHLQQTLNVNLMGVVHCTRRAFRSMQQREVAGHIVLMNSLTGEHIIAPPEEQLQTLNMYPLTKHAITALLEVLRQELHGFKTKIKVTSVSPGVTDTEILPPGYDTLPMMRPEDVADGILYALGTPPHVQVHQLTIKPLGEPF